MTTFDLVNKTAQEIIVKDRLLSSDYEQPLINKMVKSIKEIGLQNPILITEEDILIDGLIRLKAMEKLELKIPCFIIRKKDSNLLKQIEIDNNLIRRQLTKWQHCLLLKAKKDVYEILHPTSTKTAKSSNNLKDKEERKETEKSFSTVAAQEEDCSEKTITNSISNVDKIESKNPKTIDLLSDYEKSTNNKLKGIEISAIADLSIEDIIKLSKIMEEKINNNEKFKISDILTDGNKKYSKNEQLNMILEYEIQLLQKNKNHFDNEKIEMIKNFKKVQKVNFSKTLKNHLKV